jgi:hypothetical protein
MYPEAAFNKAKTKASKVGVTVKRSTEKGKKLDVIKNGKKMFAIGDSNYEDFNQHGDQQRRKNYRTRHAKNISKTGSRGYFAAKILW